MKILVLNGSPKRDLSDTMHITRAFLEGMAQATDIEVKTIHVVDKRINYCNGCFTCKKNGGKCVIDDDMAEIMDDVVKSDAIIFSFPLYFFGMPGPMKTLLDRSFPLYNMMMTKVGDKYLHEELSETSHLRYIMICGCGFPNSKYNFESVITQFKEIFPSRHTIITVPESPMFNVPAEEATTAPKLELLRQAGKMLITNGKVDSYTRAMISSPMINDDKYAYIVNKNT